ncbi:hypothetical protein Q9Z21_000832 [Staphylococcus pseudintermedius]|nr:hypothetical protein [Staphylococcus pseudintermedius]
MEAVEIAINKLKDLKIPCAEFNYEVEEKVWVNIYHNISDLIMEDDEVADKISKILKLELIDKEIISFSFCER